VPSAKRSIRLNQLDFFAVAMEDIFPTFTQLVTLRFKTAHSPSDVREALRHMFRIHPRLRALLHPTLLSYRLNILDDEDPAMEDLFDGVFRVVRNVRHGSKEYLRFRRDLLNEPADLEHRFHIKACYLPDNKTPVLLMSIHHLSCDGIGWMHMIEAMVAYLNGVAFNEVRLDNPSLVPMLIEKPWYRLPLQLIRSYRNFKKSRLQMKGDRPLTHKEAPPSEVFGSVDMHDRVLTHSLKSIHRKSRELGGGIFSLTVMMFAAFALALEKQASHGNSNVIHIYFIINTRPFFHGKKPLFGNYLVSGLIRIPSELWDEPRLIVKEIKNQLLKNIYQVKDRNTLYPMLLNKLATLIGKKNYVRLARLVKRKGMLPLTYTFSNLGTIDRLNTYGMKSQVVEAIGTIPQHGLFITSSCLNGRINTNFSYPEDIFTRDEIVSFIEVFDESMGELLRLDEEKASKTTKKIKK
jgi:hypothetical protein